MKLNRVTPDMREADFVKYLENRFGKQSFYVEGCGDRSSIVSLYVEKATGRHVGTFSGSRTKIGRCWADTEET